MSVELRNESGLSVDEASLAALARYVLDHFGVNPQAELSVYLVDEGSISNLHLHYLGEAGPTDVLAFGMDELPYGRGDEEQEELPPTLLGDVVLCPAVAARQAASAGHPVGEELALLTVHGVLHLLGYDHADPASEREMFELQAELCSGFARSGRAR